MAYRGIQEMLAGWTRSTRWLGRVNLFCAAGLCAVAALLLWDLRQDAERHSDITSRSLIQVLGRDIARNVDLYGLSLQSVAEGVRHPEILALAPDIRQRLLFDHAASATGFGTILVVDRDGNALFSSKPIPKGFTCRECENYRHLSTHAETGLYISPPATSKLTGRQAVVLSRRLTNPDGSFAGVVSGAILLDYFRGLFAAVGVEHKGVVTLYGADGTIVMREPYRAEDIGASVAQTPSYQKLRQVGDGSFVGPAMMGDGNRHFEVAPVGTLPLALSIAVTPDDVYAGWWWKAVVLGAVVLSLSTLTIVLTTLFRRELEERKRTEREMAAVNLELEKLAITDGLTGLYNRRRFDEVLAREWKRARRTQRPLSLLIFDADWFKEFNDRYGHQRGDEALKLIARAIDAATDPTVSIGCRIGGEEFAVVLPDTTVDVAVVTANRIRELVAAWKLPHRASACGVLTVSGGVAAGGGSDTAAALVAMADAALYEAKLAGRNQVRSAGPLDEALARPGVPLRVIAS